MAIKTPEEQLEEVQTAISEILTAGQSVSIRDAAKQRAQLQALHEREKWLLEQVRKESRGGPRIYQAVPRG